MRAEVKNNKPLTAAKVMLTGILIQKEVCKFLPKTLACIEELEKTLLISVEPFPAHQDVSNNINSEY